MERVAIISDIHGNMPALEAVLADIEHRAIDRVFCLGDLVGKGPDSDCTVDVCRARCERVVRGNWDDGLVNAVVVDPVGHWHRERLGPERLAYLAELPNTIDFVLGGCRVRLLHASPFGVYHRIHQADPADRLLTMFDNTDFTGDGPAPDVVVYGDIHTAYLRTLGRKILFNVGSVGNPLDVPLASYAVVEGSPDGTASGPFSIGFTRVPYDIERAIKDAEASGMPDLAAYARELRTARYRHV